ncbi:hypothetical protein TSAR_005892 [Trichomalopsis sarcophagae]|uniref:Uncharacterized protein n=1 Tax=Trichomalopsis sarcophagae TaxID=543379 RepID=A0A232F0G3_9HYME|nr:hypothetical protein TSAR_005892 [Trichomalopsis sarcophagae]
MKWVILAFGIFAVATAGPTDYSDEEYSNYDSFVDMNPDVQPGHENRGYMTVKEAEEWHKKDS